MVGWAGELTQEAPKGFQFFHHLTDRVDGEDFGEVLETCIEDVGRITRSPILDLALDLARGFRQPRCLFACAKEGFRRMTRSNLKRELFRWKFVRFEVVSEWREHRGNDWDIQLFDSTMKKV